MNPYSIELENEYPEAFGSFRLPVAVVMVTINGKFCCNAGIDNEGMVDILLPEDTYRKLKTGRANILFPTFVHSPGEAGQLEAIEIVFTEGTTE